MRKYWTTFFWIPRLGIGAALLALFVFTSASHASVVIVNNLSNPLSGVSAPNYGFAQDFSTGTGSGLISSVTLVLNIDTVNSVGVYIYNASADPTGPTGSGTLLGTITATATGNHQQYTLSGPSLATYSFTAGSDYGIVIATSSSIQWNYDNPNTGFTGVGAFLDPYWYDSGWHAGAGAFGLGVDVVPEVPMTGMFMGIGALAIAAGHTLRRKLCPAKSV